MFYWRTPFPSHPQNLGPKAPLVKLASALLLNPCLVERDGHPGIRAAPLRTARRLPPAAGRGRGKDGKGRGRGGRRRGRGERIEDGGWARRRGAERFEPRAQPPHQASGLTRSAFARGAALCPHLFSFQVFLVAEPQRSLTFLAAPRPPPSRQRHPDIPRAVRAPRGSGWRDWRRRARRASCSHTKQRKALPLAGLAHGRGGPSAAGDTHRNCAPISAASTGWAPQTPAPPAPTSPRHASRQSRFSHSLQGAHLAPCSDAT